MNSLSNSESALDKFAKKIDFTKLEGKPEAFYKAGLTFVENGQFDDGIIEFVKIIKTISHQDSLFVDAVKELKSLGFSDTDINKITGIHKSDSTNVNAPTDIKDSNSEGVDISKTIHLFASIGYIAILAISTPFILISLIGTPIPGLIALWTIVSIIISRILIAAKKPRLAYLFLFSPIVAYIILMLFWV
ncbi:MAG: hypothetical protein J0M11_17660 [Anaerolineae bacterium]|nr:hypothetical protein [Anaerolineae bacterium]